MKMKLAVDLVLASQSPRRRRLLERLGLSFTVQVSPAEEVMPDDADPPTLVQTLAVDKVQPVAAAHPRALTLAADTLVALNGSLLGKPDSTDAARAMLHRLSGQTHTVYTGVAISHPASNRLATATVGTEVTFGVLSDAEIDAYVATGAPMDKAGSYGIQDDTGALFVERIDGDYYNVVGLPLRQTYLLLRDQFGEFVTL